MDRPLRLPAFTGQDGAYALNRARFELEGTRSGGRHATKLGANEREAGFAFEDGGFSLALEGTVDDRELPARRRFRRPDRVSAAEEAHVLDDVARLMDPGQGRSEPEIHVSKKTVLCVSSAHRHGS